MLGRAVSFPIMFILPFHLLVSGAFMQHLKRVNDWTMTVLHTAVGIAGDLIVKYGPLSRSREHQQIQRA